MSIRSFAHSFPAMVACFLVLCVPGNGAAQDRVRSKSSKSSSLEKRLSDSLNSRIKSKYDFKSPEEIHTGETHSIDFTLRAQISTAELARFISELSAHTQTTSSPCLMAELNFLDTNRGIVVKEITRPHQKLLANTENRWNWQVKGLKPGQYLLTLTVSVCASESGRDPVATPLSISHRLRVIGAPVEESSSTPIILLTVVACGLAYLLFKFLTRRGRDMKIRVPPPAAGGRIFASYAKEDRDRVSKIVQELEAAGHSVWMDRESIEHAASWRAEIVSALSNSNCVVFFASKSSYESINVGRELEMAQEEHHLIIPVLLENCEAKGASRFVVAGLQRIDAREDTPKSVASQIAQAILNAASKPSAKTALNAPSGASSAQAAP